ncbi:hypothetical protein FRC02_002997 [Tulasnella sp. 418]|nr:hypothetical protein FRC02_002997 [Tulasnella sp. 418]
MLDDVVTALLSSVITSGDATFGSEPPSQVKRYSTKGYSSTGLAELHGTSSASHRSLPHRRNSHRNQVCLSHITTRVKFDSNRLFEIQTRHVDCPLSTSNTRVILGRPCTFLTLPKRYFTISLPRFTGLIALPRHVKRSGSFDTESLVVLSPRV